MDKSSSPVEAVPNCSLAAHNTSIPVILHHHFINHSLFQRAHVSIQVGADAFVIVLCRQSSSRIEAVSNCSSLVYHALTQLIITNSNLPLKISLSKLLKTHYYYYYHLNYSLLTLPFSTNPLQYQIVLSTRE